MTYTNGEGQVVTSASPVATTTVSTKSGGKSNTGAIVGGVVGGVVGLALIAALLFFLFRRKRKSHRADFDDGMFDPSRSQNHAPVDLADPATNTVEPFYTPGPASTVGAGTAAGLAAGSAATSPQMSQYPRSAATTSDGGYGAQDLSRGPSTATSAGFAGRGAGTTAFPEAMPTGIAAGAAGGGMAAKQREAYQEAQRFRVQNQASAPGGSGSGGMNDPTSPVGSSGSGPVTVHEDAGAIDQSEIPPTYDSIRR